jgi:hypothetical protein
MCTEVAKINDKSKSSIHATMKKEKEICVSFATLSQTAKIMIVVQ